MIAHIFGKNVLCNKWVCGTSLLALLELHCVHLEVHSKESSCVA